MQVPFSKQLQIHPVIGLKKYLLHSAEKLGLLTTHLLVITEALGKWHDAVSAQRDGEPQSYLRSLPQSAPLSVEHSPNFYGERVEKILSLFFFR
jgi:hypothetical protein